MKAIRIIILVSTITILIQSCNNYYSDYSSIKDMKWFKEDIKTFKVNIKEAGNYNLYFTMRFPTGYPYINIKANISMIKPNNEELTKNISFLVRDSTNNYLGAVAGEIWDFEDVFSKNTFLKKGEYKFAVKNNMNSNPVLAVISIGLKIKQIK